MDWDYYHFSTPSKSVLPAAFLTEVAIYSIYAMGCSFLIGRLGLTSFGQPAFLAFGAYGAGVYLYYFGTNPFVAILVGILTGLVINMIVGLFFVRLNSSYFTLCNQAFCVVTFFIFQKALVKWTFGDNGLLLISRMEPTPIIDLTSSKGVYLFAFLMAIAVWLFMNYLMKTDGSFYRILIAPVQRSSIVLGQVLEAVCCTFLETIILCFVSLFFSVKIVSGFLGLLVIILLVFLTAFFMAGLTYAISLCLPNEVLYETVMNAIVLPIFFLSTALFPENKLSGELKIAVNLNPFTHVINVLRNIILQGNIVTHDVILAILLLAIMCLISFSWALHRLNKETSL